MDSGWKSNAAAWDAFGNDPAPRSSTERSHSGAVGSESTWSGAGAEPPRQGRGGLRRDAPPERPTGSYFGVSEPEQRENRRAMRMQRRGKQQIFWPNASHAALRRHAFKLHRGEGYELSAAQAEVLNDPRVGTDESTPLHVASAIWASLDLGSAAVWAAAVESPSAYAAALDAPLDAPLDDAPQLSNAASGGGGDASTSMRMTRVRGDAIASEVVRHLHALHEDLPALGVFDTFKICLQSFATHCVHADDSVRSERGADAFKGCERCEGAVTTRISSSDTCAQCASALGGLDFNAVQWLRRQGTRVCNACLGDSFMAPHGVGRTGWDVADGRKWVWRTPDGAMCTKGHPLRKVPHGVVSGPCPGCSAPFARGAFAYVCSINHDRAGGCRYARCSACLNAAKKRAFAARLIKSTLAGVEKKTHLSLRTPPMKNLLALSIARTSDALLRQVGFLLCTVTFYANLAHSLTCSP